MARSSTMALQAGQNFWRVDEAEQFAFIVDADDYFRNVRKAMVAARHSIMLVGWDFDARITLGHPDDGGPARLGDFILWLADRSPELEIRLLRWDTGAFKTMLRGNNLFTILRWKAHPRITLHLDRAHPLASSHHQKMVAIDDCIAFCGGIDMTIQRWDTRDHRDDDPRRVGPDGKAHPPWHDLSSAFDGPAARAIGDLARARWKAATGETLPVCSHPHKCWPEGLQPTFTHLRLGISRTQPLMEGVTPVHEIENVYLELIRSARRMVYLESQYFASRKIAHAIAERLLEEDGPEFVIINPFTAEGWLEPLAMDTARARLMEALRRIDRYGRLRMYHPVTRNGGEIYVHAKVMVVDDIWLRVGSSNCNNRSMRLDTECDVILSSTAPGCEKLGEKITMLRNDLLAEHLGVSPETVGIRLSRTGSLIATVEQLRGPGRSLVPYECPDLNGFEAWLADNEILDPNGPDEIFEPLSNRSLFKGWEALRRRFQRHNGKD